MGKFIINSDDDAFYVALYNVMLCMNTHIMDICTYI